MGSSRTYTAKTDNEAIIRLSKAQMKGEWLSACLKWSTFFLWSGFILYYFPHFFASQQGEWVGLGVFVAFAFLLGFVSVMVGWQQSIDKCRSNRKIETWECELSDEAYCCKDSMGIGVQIPWSQMKVKLEHPDGYVVNYWNRDVIIFRKPLKDAGLDEEFAQRISEAKSE